MASMVWRRLVCAALLAALLGSGERLAGRPAGGPARSTARGLARATRRRPRRQGRRLLASSVALLAGSGRAQEGAVAGEAEPAVGLFAGLDANNDGFVDPQEFRDTMAEGFEDRDLDDDVMQRVQGKFERLFAHADMDGDGLLNEREVDYLEHIAEYSNQLEFDRSMMKRFEQALEDLAAEMEADEAAQLLEGGDAIDEAADVAGESGSSEEKADVAIENEGTDDEAEDYDEFGGEAAKVLFSELDEDGDGKISKEEFMASMVHSAGDWGLEGFTEDADFLEWGATLFGKADVNGDGSLSDKELHYATFILDTDIASGRFLEKSLATELIGGLDANGDGKLDKEEIDAAFEKFDIDKEGPEKPNLLQRISAIFPEVDTDGDGALDRHETAKLADRLIHDDMHDEL